MRLHPKQLVASALCSLMLLASSPAWAFSSARAVAHQPPDAAVAPAPAPPEPPVAAPVPAARVAPRSAVELPKLVAENRARAEAENRSLPPNDLRYDTIQFADRAALETFATAWAFSSEERLRIVHIGDSHVQAGWSTAVLRDRMRAIHGDGGYGLVFPYSTATPYAPERLVTKHGGDWNRVTAIHNGLSFPLGLVGMSSRATAATDWATIDFGRSFSAPNSASANWTKVTSFCREGPGNLDLSLDWGSGPVVVPLAAGRPGRLGVQRAELAPTRSLLRIAPVGADPGSLECEGFSIESSQPGGVIVDAVGVGGAQFRSFLRAEYLVEQLGEISPDLVILDLGTNDYLYENRIEPALESEIRALIGRVRRAKPSASILLTTVQDLEYKRKAVTQGDAFVELIQRIAASEGCAVWDWFHLSGGQGTLQAWREAGLARPDMIHLTKEGYERKGAALADALTEVIAWMEQHPEGSRLLGAGAMRLP